MRTLKRIPEVRAALAERRRMRQSIGFVPTMGALHEGHLSLIRAAAARCEVVIVSIFVNPTQFSPGEDLERYPRDLASDIELASDAGADLLFAPEVDEVYPVGFATTVEVHGLTEVLCGAPASRGAEHFRGVTTVVAKLLNVVAPHVAFFGQKDAQQAIVLRRMVADLAFNIEIAIEPTVRDSDGLALSSRNAYLSEAERERALAIPRAISLAGELAATRPLGEAVAAAENELRSAGVQPEYVEARHADDLSVATTWGERPVLIAVAATVGPARLIDNTILEPRPVTEPTAIGSGVE